MSREMVETKTTLAIIMTMAMMVLPRAEGLLFSRASAEMTMDAGVVASGRGIGRYVLIGFELPSLRKYQLTSLSINGDGSPQLGFLRHCIQ